MKVILHIGSDKTGTTALQAILSHNRKKLSSQGVIYPKLGHGHNHEKLAKTIDYDYKNETTDQLYKILNENKGTLLISSEYFCTYKKSSIKRLKSMLIGHEIEIICYARDPVEYLESGIVQKLKSAESSKKANSIYLSATSIPFLCNLNIYRAGLKLKFIKIWKDVFQTQTVHIRPYLKNCWLNEDLFDDFASTLNIQYTPLNKPPAKANKNQTPELSVAYACHILSTGNKKTSKYHFSEILTREFNQTRKHNLFSPMAHKLTDWLATKNQDRHTTMILRQLRKQRSIPASHSAPSFSELKKAAHTKIAIYCQFMLEQNLQLKSDLVKANKDK